MSSRKEGIRIRRTKVETVVQQLGVSGSRVEKSNELDVERGGPVPDQGNAPELNTASQKIERLREVHGRSRLQAK